MDGWFSVWWNDADNQNKHSIYGESTLPPIWVTIYINQLYT